MRRFDIRSWRDTPALAAIAVLLLVIAGVAAAWFNEGDFRQQKMEQAQAQARILAASVAAALAFEDVEDARLSIAALNANPDVAAVGVYSADGVFFAGVSSDRGSPPYQLQATRAPRYENNSASATALVSQADTQLGYVYLKLSAGSAVSRWARYLGIALVLFMAIVVLVVIANAQRALSSANSELSRRADALAASNTKLHEEVSERRKAQLALAQAQKMEAIGQLTGGIAHDFNNLLMVISGGLRLLSRQDADEAKRGNVVAAMRQAVDRGADLTRQLLAFSRRQKLSPEVVVIEDRLISLRPLLERSLREDISLIYEFPAGGTATKVDPGQFDMAILNLAVNARDAMPDGGALTIRVTRIDQGAVALSVVDTGTGMSADVQARAFDPFFTTKEVGKGTGLGLSQVYGFAVQSGGRCEIDSQVGKGTAITLTLPTTDEAVAARPDETEHDASGAGNVLVVEDDESVAMMVCEMLADLGYTALRVANAAEALHQLESGEPIDLMFTDIIMPGGMNGVELAREARKRRADLPIVLTTGYGGRGETEVEGFPVLRKPYDRDALGAALATAK